MMDPSASCWNWKISKKEREGEDHTSHHTYYSFIKDWDNMCLVHHMTCWAATAGSMEKVSMDLWIEGRKGDWVFHVLARINQSTVKFLKDKDGTILHSSKILNLTNV